MLTYSYMFHDLIRKQMGTLLEITALVEVRISAFFLSAISWSIEGETYI